MGLLPQLSSVLNCPFAEFEQDNETIKQFVFVLQAMETLIPSWERISVRGEAAISICNQAVQPEKQAVSSRNSLASCVLHCSAQAAAPGEAPVLPLIMLEKLESLN